MRTPQRFTSTSRGPYRLLARRDLAERVVEAGVLDQGAPLSWEGAGQSIDAGRGSVVPLELPGEPPLKMIVKILRRGGVLGLVNRELHLSETRLADAIELSEHLADRGVPTSEAVFGRSEKVAGPFYRLCLATKEITGARPLLDLLADGSSDESERFDLARKAGETVRALHDAGVHHADLNMNNLLVTPLDGEGREWTVHVIDLDGSRLAPAVDERSRAANLARLLRHAVKNGLHCSIDLDAAGRALLEGYCRDGDSRPIAPRVLDTFARSLQLHRISWRFQGINPPPFSFER